MVRSHSTGETTRVGWPSFLACAAAIGVASATMAQAPSTSPLDRRKTRLPAVAKPLPATGLKDAAGRMGLNKPASGSNARPAAAAGDQVRVPERVRYNSPTPLVQMEGRPLLPGRNLGTGVEPSGELSGYRQETAQQAQDRLARALKTNGFEDVEVGARVRTGAGSPIRATPRDVQQTQLEREALSRAPAASGLTAQMDRAIAQSGASLGIEAARQKYASQGYKEVELAPGDTAFVKGSEDSIRRLEASRESIRDASVIPVAAPQPRCGMHRAVMVTTETARPVDREFPNPCDECVRRCEDDDRRAVVGEGMYEGGNPNGDQFIRTGSTIAPVPAPDSPEALAGDPAARGDSALRAGKLKVAADAYSEYLAAYPDDTHVQRLKAMALLLDGRTGPGVELLNKAYTADPSLASIPVNGEQLPENGDALRKAVLATVGQANRANGSGAACLAAAVLMQAEGRGEPAAKMASRAAERGVDAAVIRELKAALAAK